VRSQPAFLGQIVQELDLVGQLIPDLRQISGAAFADLQHNAVLVRLEFLQQVRRTT
jgi:hypothetical protein